MAPCNDRSLFPSIPPPAYRTPRPGNPVSFALILPFDPFGDILTSPIALIVAFILASITFGLLGVWLKEREVAARIAGMGAGIESIRTGSTLPPRLPTIQDDPISRFVDEVNRVLAELERSRRELQESRDRYRLLFESGNDFLLVCAVGREGTPYRILDANALACRCLGYTRDELFTLTPGAVIIIRSDFQKGDQHLHSADLIPREGNRIPVEASIHHITLGGTPAILIIARDVTERRRTEKELMDYRYRLEELVTQRTEELRAANENLKREIRERERIERERMEAYGRSRGTSSSSRS